MKKIKYTQDAVDKLYVIKKDLVLHYGDKIAKEIIGNIMDAINGLKVYEKKGPLVERMFEVNCDYHYIVVSRNYVFYRIETDCIKIINIYNEKEDFMWQLFGVDTTSQESIDYWDS